MLDAAFSQTSILLVAVTDTGSDPVVVRKQGEILVEVILEGKDRVWQGGG